LHRDPAHGSTLIGSARIVIGRSADSKIARPADAKIARRADDAEPAPA
jgi:hypothetical protein